MFPVTCHMTRAPILDPTCKLSVFCSIHPLKEARQPNRDGQSGSTGHLLAVKEESENMLRPRQPSGRDGQSGNIGHRLAVKKEGGNMLRHSARQATIHFVDYISACIRLRFVSCNTDPRSGPGGCRHRKPLTVSPRKY